jgi:hypothetical protein
VTARINGRPWSVWVACVLAWLSAGPCALACGVGAIALAVPGNPERGDTSLLGFSGVVEFLIVAGLVGFVYGTGAVLAGVFAFRGGRVGRFLLALSMAVFLVLGVLGAWHDPSAPLVWVVIAWTGAIVVLLYAPPAHGFFAGA